MEEEFNRYIWSIETIAACIVCTWQIQFNRYIWSIETIFRLQGVNPCNLI